MVSLAEIPSLRLDSCCKVEVVKGGEGLRVVGFSSVFVTVQGLPSSLSLRALASASFSSTTLRPWAIFPVLGSKSLPVAIFFPDKVINFASKGLLSCSNNALRSQYPPDWKARRSLSRWTNNRTATDCTRPADNPQAIFFQRRGERV